MSDSEEFDMFGVSHGLVPPAPIKPAGASEIDFDGLLSPPLKLHEDLKNGCGGQLWPAGMVLSKYMLRMHKSDLVGKEMYAKNFAVKGDQNTNTKTVSNWVLEVGLLGEYFSIPFFKHPLSIGFAVSPSSCLSLILPKPCRSARLQNRQTPTHH